MPCVAAAIEHMATHHIAIVSGMLLPNHRHSGTEETRTAQPVQHLWVIPLVRLFPNNDFLLLFGEKVHVRNIIVIFRRQSALFHIFDMLHQIIFIAELFYIAEELVVRDVGKRVLKHGVQPIATRRIDIEDIAFYLVLWVVLVVGGAATGILFCVCFCH